MARERREYKNGYQGKLDYWNEQLEIANANGDQFRITRATKSIKHFAAKQKELADKKLEEFLKKA